MPSTLLRLTCVKPERYNCVSLLAAFDISLLFVNLCQLEQKVHARQISFKTKQRQTRKQNSAQRTRQNFRLLDMVTVCYWSKKWFLNSASTIGITVISVSSAESTRCTIYLSITDRSSFVVVSIYFCQLQIFVQFMLSCDTCISSEKMSLITPKFQPNF